MMEELESGFLYKVLFEKKIVRWLDSTGIRMNAGRTTKRILPLTLSTEDGQLNSLDGGEHSIVWLFQKKVLVISDISKMQHQLDFKVGSWID